ncbi:MAG: ABC transporter permease [Anaerolineaceae bacterium]|nr:ABC transporter permease [Anaerolineaceae bacterium]
MIPFMVRNLKLYFRDKSAVFFSLLGILVILTLYLLFLGNVWVSNFNGVPGVRFVMDSWIMAGLLAISSFTTTMGALGVMVDDKVKKINKDFVASPFPKSSMTAGYIFSTILIGVVMSLVSLLIAEVYILINGGSLINLPDFLKVFALIVLATLSNSAIVVFLVSLFKTNSAYGTASTLIGTMIGFLTGIYLPIGEFPSSIQWLIKLFPPSHAAALMRQVMMAPAMEKTFAGAPQETLTNFKRMMGVEFTFGNTPLSPFISVIILLATAVFFYLLALWSLSRKKN